MFWGLNVSQKWQVISYLRKDRKGYGNLALAKTEEWKEHYEKLLTKSEPKFNDPFEEVHRYIN